MLQINNTLATFELNNEDKELRWCPRSSGRLGSNRLEWKKNRDD